MHRLKIESALGRFSSENRKNGPQTSISVAMYLLFASVFGSPLWAFHASLSPTISSYPQFHHLRSRVPFLSLRSRLLAEGLGSIHDAIHIAFCRIKFQSARFPHTRSMLPGDAPMLCLYSPYNRSRSSAGGRADPVLGIFRTVWSACANTLSASVRLATVSEESEGRGAGGGGGLTGVLTDRIRHCASMD